jgi:protein tyrosine phosphatase
MLSTGTLTRGDLVEPLHQLLTQWRSERGVDGYYDIPLRSPYKAQVVSTELNRFGGGMGAYTDAFVNDVPEVPYINATPFTFEDDLDEFKYIGTMCPKINTFDHFWRMVWHKNTRVVVNLTHTDDRIGSERGDKREKYWPPYSTAPSQQELDKWPLEVSTTASNIADSMPGLILYDITLTHKASGEVRVVKLYWYSSWEDFGDSSAIYDASFRQNAMNALMLANEVNAEQLSAAPSASSASSSSKAFATSATTNNHTTHNNTNNTSSSTMSNSYTKSTNDEWLIVHCSAGVGEYPGIPYHTKHFWE